MEDGYMYHYQTLKKKINETILVTVNDPLGVIIFFNLQLWRVFFVTSDKTVTLLKSFGRKTEDADPKHYKAHREECDQNYHTGRVGTSREKLNRKRRRINVNAILIHVNSIMRYTLFVLDLFSVHSVIG